MMPTADHDVSLDCSSAVEAVSPAHCNKCPSRELPPTCRRIGDEKKLASHTEYKHRKHI